LPLVCGSTGKHYLLQITDTSGALPVANLVVTITGTNDVPTVSGWTASKRLKTDLTGHVGPQQI